MPALNAEMRMTALTIDGSAAIPASSIAMTNGELAASDVLFSWHVSWDQGCESGQGWCSCTGRSDCSVSFQLMSGGAPDDQHAADVCTMSFQAISRKRTEQEDTPEDAANGLGHVAARVGSLTGSQRDDLSAEVREGGVGEAPARSQRWPWEGPTHAQNARKRPLAPTMPCADSAMAVSQVDGR